MPQPGWQRGQVAYCSTHHLVAGRHPVEIAYEALSQASAFHDMGADDLVMWPWQALNDLAGPLVPGRLTYVAAFPGAGKTTLLTQAIHSWMRQGKRITYLPLEADAGETMTRMACLELGISADEALSKRLRLRADAGDVEAEGQVRALRRAYRDMVGRREQLTALRIEPIDMLTVTTFARALQAAHVMDSDLVIVDHVDHVEADHDEVAPEIQISNQLQSMALRAAKALKIPIVLATQLNSSRTGHDPLAHYRPPVTDWLFNKGKKEQMAAVIIGLFRPIDPTASTEDIADVRARSKAPWQIAKPNRMGIAGMKLRYGGALKDRTVELHYEHGRLTDLPLPDALDVAADRQQIRTGSPSMIGARR